MKQQDFLIIVDATGSMSYYLKSLISSLPQIIPVSALTGCFSRIGVLAYRDYTEGDAILEWSGWLDQTQEEDSQSEQPDLVAFVKDLKSYGGEDYHEAIKTALAKACEVMREDAETLIFLYTDGPAHPVPDKYGNDNPSKEKTALSRPGSYSEYGKYCIDWVSATNALRNGPKKAQVFAILDRDMLPGDAAWYKYLTERTNGSCLDIRSKLPEVISKLTVDLLLAWMGVKKEGVGSNEVQTEDQSDRIIPDLTQYNNLDGIDSFQDEKDPRTKPFFSNNLETRAPCRDNISKIKLTADVMETKLAKKAVSVQDFAKRWTTDDQYKERVVKHLLIIIKDQIQALTLNPVFGTMWRAVCSDRKYPRRDEILLAFNHRLEKMASDEKRLFRQPALGSSERVRMKAWLEESYDFSGEIVSIINDVPESERYPCVFLDPTLVFSSAETGSEEKSHQHLSSFTREDLLEIGRSCAPKILRRLGTILSRLTVVESESDMPDYISDTTNKDLAKIPLVLASEKYDRQFWKILFHLIKPGTRISARPAALAAALSLRVGFKPLQEVAKQEMLTFKDKWNDLSIPETWSVGCLTLLIDADEAYQKQVQGQTKDKHKLLHPSDRLLFERLTSFDLLEINLKTPLNAQVPWTPKKTLASVGPLVTCKQCQYPRSVTVMGKGGYCGLCLFSEFTDEEQKETLLNTGILKESFAKATWVECFSRDCRAQYVVYNVKHCNVIRPKCHYCRNQKEKTIRAPVVECTRCWNRMIWPHEYRESSFVESEFVCPPCTSGCGPTENVDVTAEALMVQNGSSWLIKEPLEHPKLPFLNYTIFATIREIGIKRLNSIKFFPVSNFQLYHDGKRLHNSEQLIESLRKRVENRWVSRTKCSLCFMSFRHGMLARACGRHGCSQHICTACLSGWYGLNSAGTVINTAALACPFCRQFPAARTLAKHGMGIHAVRDLASAVRDRDRLIYAWCRECHTAKEWMERSCSNESPGDLRDWVCHECVEKQELEDPELKALDAERRALKSAKPCPKCTVMTVKISGCGHMKCSVDGCGIDWCYFCGDEFDERSIYKHMDKVHGGFFGGGIDVDDEMEDTDVEMEDSEVDMEEYFEYLY